MPAAAAAAAKIATAAAAAKISTAATATKITPTAPAASTETTTAKSGAFIAATLVSGSLISRSQAEIAAIAAVIGIGCALRITLAKRTAIAGRWRRAVETVIIETVASR